MLSCCILLDKCYGMDSDIEDIDHDCLESFLRIDLNEENETFEKLYEEINKIKLNNTVLKEKVLFA